MPLFLAMPKSRLQQLYLQQNVSIVVYFRLLVVAAARLGLKVKPRGQTQGRGEALTPLHLL